MVTPPRRKTAPAGVAVASKSRDFSRPDANPKALQNRTDGRDEMHTTAERLAARRRSRGRRRPPRPPSGTGRWDPARRCLADYRHRHGAQQRTTQAPPRLGQPLAPPRCPATSTRRHRACLPRQPNRRPPQPRWAEQARGRSCSSRGASAAGRSRTHRWSLAALVAGPRDTTPPDHRRRPRRRRQG
jgi:hypothetical protein